MVMNRHESKILTSMLLFHPTFSSPNFSQSIDDVHFLKFPPSSSSCSFICHTMPFCAFSPFGRLSQWFALSAHTASFKLYQPIFYYCNRRSRLQLHLYDRSDASRTVLVFFGADSPLQVHCFKSSFVSVVK